MVKMKFFVLVCIATAIGLAAWFMLTAGDERKVRRVFDKVANIADKRAEENIIVMATKAKLLEKLLDDHCQVAVSGTPLHGTFIPSELSAICIQARTRFRSCKLSFSDLKITFPEEDVARAIFTARLSGTLAEGGQISEFHEMEAELVKRDGEWRFRLLRTVQTLTK